MMTKNLKKTLLIVAMLVFSLSLSLFAFTASPVKANTEFAGELTMTMDKGALLRVSTEADLNDSGLRFRATLTNYNENDKTLKYGVVIIPADYLTTYEITANEYVQDLDALVQAGTISTYINGLAKPVQIDGRWVVQHSIAPIKAGNFNREFFGVAYVTDGTNYKYAELNDNERSVTYISSAALNELKYNENLEEGTKSLYLANETMLKNFVQQGVKNVTEELTYQITGNNVTNQPNGTINLSLNITDGVNIQSKWFSSDTEVAEVDGNGVVTMKQYGAATITVRSAGLYSSSVLVSAAEEGVVAPFNTYSATDFMNIDTEKTHYTASVNSDANYTYGDEAYSLKLSRTSSYNGGVDFYLKNCIITDLNAKDVEGNYLYNYMTFSIYVDHHGSSDVDLRVGANDYKKVATNTWLTYLITRDGKSENFVGGVFNDKVLVSDLNTFRISVWQNAGKKAIDVYFSAVRVGALDANVAVPFNMQGGVNFVTLNESGGRISSGLPVNGEGQPIKYNGEETALKVAPGSSYTGGKRIILKASLIDDLTVKEGESYKYNTITFGVYIESQLTKEDIVVFGWGWLEIETNKWVTLSFNRDGQTNNFICDNSAFTGSKEITSLMNKTLGIYIDGAGQSDAFYVSAIRVS